MALLGKINILTVLKDAPPGLYLDGGDLGEILLPGDSIPPGAGPDDELQVFLYRDSEDRLVATTHDPLACVGDFAALRVKQIHPTIGAFLDWGLNKDLLLPMREQERRIHKGDIVVVFVFIDEVSQRIIATTRWRDHLSATPPNYSEGAPVSLLIAGESPLGYNAIVDNAHVGLLFRSELGSSLKVGDKCKGYVRNVRPDGKLDLGLDPEGYQRIAPLADRLSNKQKGLQTSDRQSVSAETHRDQWRGHRSAKVRAAFCVASDSNSFECGRGSRCSPLPQGKTRPAFPLEDSTPNRLRCAQRGRDCSKMVFRKQ